MITILFLVFIGRNRIKGHDRKEGEDRMERESGDIQEFNKFLTIYWKNKNAK